MLSADQIDFFTQCFACMAPSHTLLSGFAQIPLKALPDGAEAHKASIHHDSRELFQIIGRFSPKQPRRRMQLRTHTDALRPQWRSMLSCVHLCNKHGPVLIQFQ